MIARFSIAILLALGLQCAAAGNFAAAASYSRAKDGDILLVWQNGELRRDVRDGASEHAPREVFSITKSLAALAWLSRFSPETTVPVSADGRDQRPAAQLLSQTSGLDPGYRSIYRANLKDVRAAALRVSAVSGPGETFAYGPSHYELLGIQLQRATSAGTNPVEQLLLRRLGIAPGNWRTDASGNPFLSAGAALSANDLLKIGRLIVDHGRAGLLNPIVPPARLQAAFRGTDANPAYGFGFWLNRMAADPDAHERDIEEALHLDLEAADWQRTCLSKSAPGDLVCMAGSRGQRVYVSPSEKLVVVRTGRTRRFRDPEFLRLFFTESEP